jgi:O-antigen/teichoic acid export membrane protein
MQLISTINRRFLGLSPFFRGAIEAMGVNGLGLFAALVAQAALAQALGPSDFGVYSAAVSVAAVLAVFAVGGMDTALLREVPKEPLNTATLVKRAERRIVLTVIIGAPLLYLWTESWKMTAASALLAAFFAAGTIRQFALRGILLVFWGRFPDIVMRPVLVAGFVVLLGGYTILTPTLGIVLHALATALVYLFGGLVLRDRLTRLDASALETRIVPEISVKDRALWLGLSLLTILSLELDKLIGALLLTPNDFGHYALAARLYGFGVLATESLAVVAAPLAARAIARGQHAELRKLEFHLSCVLALVVVGVLGVILLFGEQAVDFLAPGFSDSVEPLTVLGLAALTAPIVLPRLSIASVIQPGIAWRLQVAALIGSAIACAGITWWAVKTGAMAPAVAVAWGVVAGAAFRAVLWRVFGRIRFAGP